jgi:hypothetical protein
LATAFSILEATRERWLGGVGLVDSIFLLEFPGTSLASYIFLLEDSYKFLGCGEKFRVT